jgi:hypothetical protein
MKAAFSILLAVSLTVTASVAQEDTAHHRAVYKEINEKQAAYRKITGTYTDEPLVFDLTGWLDEGGKLRKIATRVGEDGEGFEEYYLENEKPIFVYSTYREAQGAVVIENRLYFDKQGNLFKWLTSDRSVGSRSAVELSEEKERLSGNCANFVAALKKKTAQKSK